MPAEYVDLALPFRGLHLGAADEAIPEGFTLAPLRNVRPRDWRAGGKRRMATRPGCRKLVEDQICGSARGQGLTTVTTVENVGASALGSLLFEDDFDRSDTAVGVLGDFDGDAGADWFIYMGRSITCLSGGSTTNDARYLAAFDAGTDTNGAQVVGNVAADERSDNTTSGTGRMSYCYCVPTDTTEPTDNYALRLSFTTKSSLANTEFHAGFVCFGDKSIVAGGAIDNALIIGVRGHTGVASNFTGRMVPIYGINRTTDSYDDLGNMTPTFPGVSNSKYKQLPEYVSGPWYPALTGNADVIYPEIQPGTTYTLELRVNGVRVELLMDGVRIAVIPNVTMRADGTAATPIDATQVEFGFFCNNVGSGTRAGLSSINSFQCYRASVNAPESMVRIVAVAGGDVCVGTESSGFVTGTDATGVVSDTAELTIIPGPGPGAASSNGVQYAYLLDGQSYNKVDVATGLVSAWTASSGSLPANSLVDSQKARYGLSWDGSFVWYGIVGSPDVFGATRRLDWGDFNDTPGYAGRDGDEPFVSGISEPISCIFPIGDTRLGVASLNALYIMTARLPLGGSLPQVTDRTGVLGAFAYATDNVGNIHFIHTSGHWIMEAGGSSPQYVSRGRMDQFFRTIDPNTTRVECRWSNREDGLRIFLTNRDTPTTAVEHLFWDRQEDCYVADTLPGGMNPTAAAVYTDASGRERIIFVSNDGYLRVFDSAESDDDGQDIDGVLSLSPLTAGGLERLIVSGVEIVLGDDENDASLVVARASSVPNLLAAPASVTRTIEAGQRVRRATMRVGGSAVGIQLRGTRFSVERVRALIESGGTVYA